MGKYKVVTYRSVGNTPYIETDTDIFEEAKLGFENAKSWNYTCIIYDAEEDSLCATYQSSMDSAIISNVLAGLTGVAAAAAQSVLTGGFEITAAAGTCTTGNSLVKAIEYAMTTKYQNK
ncbi:predicted protein [Naegleria gruberi]|uniref:Predicted protein n=1 Tax=Naegleria gruberi TaxID=5762 RepID=D2VTF9_NAEGR|nr:uncharacterized protein NAEGRDRAFT_72285 [Naegleria gruberi]EFC39925.1 predicted protein [Naegleria gruberi]|eukprot:XP_002672669.1 predicted protein [Naegleria gruberi strain NEG-M]